LLLIKQQKWLSEFCVKIDRVGRVTVNTHIFCLALFQSNHVCGVLVSMLASSAVDCRSKSGSGKTNLEDYENGICLLLSQAFSNKK